MRRRTKNCSPTMTAVLTAKANPMTLGRHLADLTGERGEAGLHLAVADEHPEEGQQGHPHDGRLAQDREVGARAARSAPSGFSARPCTWRSGPSSSPIGTSMLTRRRPGRSP